MPSVAPPHAPPCYPVLCLPRQLGPFAVRDPSGLERCQSVLFWKAELYDGLQLIDSTGTRFIVVRTALRSPASCPGRWLARVLDLPLRVEVELEARGRATLDEIVAAVTAAIQADPEALEELSGRSVAWWRATLASCRDPREVIAALAASGPD